VITVPFTVTKPILMSSSASRREHTPLLEIYRFKRILSEVASCASSF
jgi:hypothetical protein